MRDMDLHGLGDAGLSLTRSAQQRADQAAQNVVQNPSDPEPLIDLSLAEREGKIGAKLLKAHDEMTGTLLDVLA
jgi:hypothetical protein